MSSTSPSLVHRCFECDQPLAANSPFCPHCGASVLTGKQREQIDEYLKGRIARELASRLESEDRLVGALSDKVEELVWKRIWRYGALVAAIVGLIAWFGFSSFKDITDSAKKRLEPIISNAEDRAKIVQSQINDVGVQVATTKQKIDGLSAEAAAQQRRLDSQSGEVTAKLQSLQRSADHANSVADGYQSKVDEAVHRLDTQVARAQTAVNNQAIAQSYPTIDAEPYAMLDGRPMDRTKKKPGDVWVQVHLTGWAISRHALSGEQFKALLKDLADKGFTPFLGTAGVGGRVSRGFEQIGNQPSFDSHVLYYRQDFKTKAEELSKIVGNHIKIKMPPEPILESLQGDDNVLKMFVDLSGIDAQVFISAAPLN